MSFTSFSTLSSLLTSAAVVSALTLVPGCSGGDVPIGQDGTNTRSGDGTSDAGVGSDGGGGVTDAAEPASCVTDSDCTGGYVCGYAIADRCSAKGTCFAPPAGGGASCGAMIANCGCDGTIVGTGCTDLPAGYASKPIATPNSSCAPADGGDGFPSSCLTSSDCGTDDVLCGFKETDACSATGTCFVASGAGCNAIVPACGCDGTITNTVCNGLPSGYTLTPVVYPIEQTCPTK